MIRKSMKLLLIAMVAIFALASTSEAAAKKVVHKRPKHSTRVSAGSTHTTKKKTTIRKTSAGTVKKTTVTKKKPTTKPH
jgi:uncharacterized protein YcfJ